MRLARPLAAAALLIGSLPLAAATADRHVGAEITVAEATPIAELIAHPDDYAGKVVRVEGEVSGVCSVKGCWMDIADDAGRRVRISVEDDVLVFPSDATGHPAVAQGKVVVEEMTKDQYVAMQKHVAAEGGPAFDESKVGDGPFRTVQIAGTGATIDG
jgi:uncharacterized protein DUF4920